MALAEQWNDIESRLDPSWSDARLDLRLADEAQASRAVALLAPAGPGRDGATVRFTSARGGTGIGPEAIRRMMRRLDAEGIAGTLELMSSGDAPAALAISRETLGEEWDAALTMLPSDWSDLLVDVELTSSDHVDRAALELAPLNPLQVTGRPGFRFRCASTTGYGASAGMVGRCMSRLDDAGIPGEIRIVRAMSDTHPVGTQGPVWQLGGKIV